MLTRNESAAMRTATSALRREVDTLDARMKEDIATLKHECVIFIDKVVLIRIHVLYSCRLQNPDGVGQ